MTVSEILLKALLGRKLKANVEVYNTNTCIMEFFKDELVSINKIETTSIVGDLEVRGSIIGGENDGKEGIFYIDVETEINLIN